MLQIDREIRTLADRYLAIGQFHESVDICICKFGHLLYLDSHI